MHTSIRASFPSDVDRAHSEEKLPDLLSRCRLGNGCGSGPQFREEGDICNIRVLRIEGI